MRTVVIGGGILGLSTGYYLAREGHQVTVLEAGPQVGGLATDVDVAGVQVDRFYHCILNADDHLLGLVEEVGLADQVRMVPVKAGFFANGETYPISTPLDILRFPPLSMVNRLRLVKSLLACRRIKDWNNLEDVDVETWLRRQSGDKVYEAVWKPLLSAKFDGDFSQTPATYIWSRTVRMSDTRSGGGRRELAGHLVGGYRTLCDRLAERIRELGGEVHVAEPVRNLMTDGGRIRQVSTSVATYDCDAAVLTVPLPISAKLLANRAGAESEPAAQSLATEQYVRQVENIEGYLGVVCLLLMLPERLSPNYTLYLADQSLPFTAVIETTNIIDPELVGGRHLVYLPKYVDPDGSTFRLPDDEIRSWFLRELRQVFPDFDERAIIAAPVFRAAHVEPLHPIGSLSGIPSIDTPIDGVWLGSTKHFYPRLNNADSVTRLAARLASEVAGWNPAVDGNAEQHRTSGTEAPVVQEVA